MDSPSDDDSRQRQARQLRAQLDENLRLFKMHGEAFEENQRLLAQLFFRRFNLLKEAGFTEQQALEIVKARGIG